MTKEAIRLKNAKYRSWNRYMVTKTAHDKDAYIRLKNNLRDLTRYLRGVFEHDIAANVKFKPKRVLEIGPFKTQIQARHSNLNKTRWFQSNKPER